MERSESPPPIGWSISFLLGVSVAGAAAGFLGFFHAAFDPLPQTTFIVLAGAALGLGAGPWMPQGLVRFVSARILLRAMNSPRRQAETSVAPLAGDSPESNEDRALLLGGSCLIAALAMLLTGLCVGSLRSLCEWLRTDFFWTPVSLRVADLVTATMVQFIPGTLLGLALVCTLGIHSDRLIGRSSTYRLSALVLGIALGSCAVFWWCRLIRSTLLTLVASAVPPLLAAILSLLCAEISPRGTKPSRPRKRFAGAISAAPEVGTEGLGLLLGGLAVWSLALATCGVVWHRLADRGFQAWALPPCGGLALWLGSLALGAALLSPRRERASQEVSTGGVRLCLAGLGAAGAVCLVSLGSWAGTNAGAGAAWLLLTAFCVHGLSNGQALPALLRSALSRFATRGLAHAAIVTSLAVAAAGGLLACGLWLLPMFGTLVPACAFCLLLVVAGGTLVIYDPRSGGSGQRLRLGAVFATLVVLVLMLPSAASRWPFDRLGRTIAGAQADTAGQVETADAVLDSGGRRSRKGLNRSGDVEDQLLVRCIRGSKVCVVGGEGSSPSSPSSDEAFGMVQVDRWPHPAAGEAYAVGASSLSRLRLARERYDLIIYNPAGPGAAANQDLWTREAFRRLAGILSAGGLVVVRIPPAGLERAEIGIVARTFWVAFEGRAVWMVFGPPLFSDRELWLLGYGRGSPAALKLATSLPGSSRPTPMAALFTYSGPSAIHSAEHPRLRRTPLREDASVNAEAEELHARTWQ